MKLTTLLGTLGQLIDASVDCEVKGVTADSRLVQENFVFVAIGGNKCDGNSFIEEAIRRGARAVVTEGAVSAGQRGHNGVIFVETVNSRVALAKLAAEFYGYPSRKLKVIGVTGTNGKTTITYLLEHILRRAGYKTGVIGTINYRFGDRVIPATNTTPGPEKIQQLLAEMFCEDIRYVAMEVSSHALDQMRVAGIDFHAGIFTNLTQDHLDYHKDMEQYFRAKSLLFKGLNAQALAIINRDDAYAQRLMNIANGRVLTYGLKSSSDISASRIRLGPHGTIFSLAAPRVKFDICTKLIGRHNVYNILAAVLFALQEGIPVDTIKDAVESFEIVPGRLEVVDAGQPFRVFVDYAHTEDAMRNVIASLRELDHRRLIVVFGCGGDRDTTKRPKMGRVASELSDEVIITADNPRSEDLNAIIADITRGVAKNNYTVIPDRRQAIETAIRMAKEDDIVLIAGKGHENYQVFKDKTIDFDDRIEARQCLQSMK